MNGTDIWLLRPEEFIRRPARYLRCFGELGARLTAIPSFGLLHLTRNITPDDLADCDFTAWRAIIVGAERVDPAALDHVHRLLAPFGLRRAAFLPAYGLAEATVAVTGVGLDEEWGTVTVDPSAIDVRRPITYTADGQQVVGCGHALHGLEVSIADEDGGILPDGHVGEIVVRGASVAADYLAGTAGGGTRLRDRTLWTGDAGFVVDRQLFVLGRMGDSIKIRGRTVFAEDVEALLDPLRPGARRLAVVLGMRRGRATCVIVLECPRKDWLLSAAELVRPRVEEATILVLAAPAGTIDWTTSGKPRRRKLWQDFVAGRIRTSTAATEPAVTSGRGR
jgi:acyl-CoA synthetase (AMP-forming)/AMP-acid ligase II